MFISFNQESVFHFIEKQVELEIYWLKIFFLNIFFFEQNLISIFTILDLLKIVLDFITDSQM